MLQPGVADASYNSPQQASTIASRQHILTKKFKIVSNKMKINLSRMDTKR
jgi:hypothetical protein